MWCTIWTKFSCTSLHCRRLIDILVFRLFAVYHNRIWKYNFSWLTKWRSESCTTVHRYCPFMTTSTYWYYADHATRCFNVWRSCTVGWMTAMERLSSQLKQGLETPRPFKAKIGNNVYKMSGMKWFFWFFSLHFITCQLNRTKFNLI